MRRRGCTGALATWLVTGLAVGFTAWLLPGVHVDALWPDAFLAAIGIGLANALVRPVLVVLTFPITVLTLGLFLLVVNGLMFMLAAWVLPGFAVAGLVPAILGALVLSVSASVLEGLLFGRRG